MADVAAPTHTSPRNAPVPVLQQVSTIRSCQTNGGAPEGGELRGLLLAALGGTTLPRCFYVQFFLIGCYYLLEYLTVVNILNLPAGAISGVPLAVMLLAVVTAKFCHSTMRHLQGVTVLVELLSACGLLIFDLVTPSNQDDRHRTEYYDTHAHAAALNFMLLLLYALVWWLHSQARGAETTAHSASEPQARLSTMV